MVGIFWQKTIFRENSGLAQIWAKRAQNRAEIGPADRKMKKKNSLRIEGFWVRKTKKNDFYFFFTHCRPPFLIHRKNQQKLKNQVFQSFWKISSLVLAGITLKCKILWSSIKQLKTIFGKTPVWPKFGPTRLKTGPKYTFLTITSEPFDRFLNFLVWRKSTIKGINGTYFGGN